MRNLKIGNGNASLLCIFGKVLCYSLFLHIIIIIAGPKKIIKQVHIVNRLKQLII